MEQELTDLDGEEIKPESEKCNCKPLASLFQCKKEGRFADKSNCRNYYRCVTDEEGFVADQFECDMGFAFDPATEACVPEAQSTCKKGMALFLQFALSFTNKPKHFLIFSSKHSLKGWHQVQVKDLGERATEGGTQRR